MLDVFIWLLVELCMGWGYEDVELKNIGWFVIGSGEDIGEYLSLKEGGFEYWMGRLFWLMKNGSFLFIRRDCCWYIDVVWGEDCVVMVVVDEIVGSW